MATEIEKEALLSVENNVATITLNRPHKGNALTATMNELLLHYLNEIENDVNIRVVILTGAGKFFCTGMDLSMAAASSSSSEHSVKASFDKGVQVYEKLAKFPKPVIARVNGPSLGGGVGLIFCTDIRVVHKDAYFALTEVKRGIIPAIISQYLVPELGKQKAREFMMTGRKITTAEASQYYSAVAANNDELNQKVAMYTAMLLEAAPGAMANVKKLIETIVSGGDSRRTDLIRKDVEEAYISMMQSSEAAYGIMAFLQKQKADWTEYIRQQNAKL
ncbi:ClpP/crotonase-like domain-containing protein [Mycotypha africana]|uniref:ClpP/crotonase-like domain-containing protein n=1 Tax=Mycotypha africana TaxID=64632 RepID=UPI0022FFCEB2|nr:ClpP/crotonase-like domain-containing protein [Mycotypha africana]KAI8975097.1 ClpP/crotonase-like domain-containing protein [Mycotypha africana]